MKFIVTEKQGTHGLLLVVTDQDLLGKFFEEGKTQLDLRAAFYKGKEKTKDEVKKLLTGTRDVVLTGKMAVALGIELDLVDPKKILYVQNVPHAQVALG